MGEVRGPARRDDALGARRAGRVEADPAHALARDPGPAQDVLEREDEGLDRDVRPLGHAARALEELVHEKAPRGVEDGGVVLVAPVVESHHHPAVGLHRRLPPRTQDSSLGSCARVRACSLLLAGTAAAQSPSPRRLLPPVEPDAIAETLFLIGDVREAGERRRAGPDRPAPAWSSGRPRDGGLRSATTSTLRGLPGARRPELPEMARRLDDQVDARRATSGPRRVHPRATTTGPGRRAGATPGGRAEERGGPSVSFRPNDGCPGPATTFASERLRLRGLRRAVADASSSSAGARAPLLDVSTHRGARRRSRRRRPGPPPAAERRCPGGRCGFTAALLPAGTECTKSLYLARPLIGSIYPVPGRRSAAPRTTCRARVPGIAQRPWSATRAATAARWAVGHEHAPAGDREPRVGAARARERDRHLRSRDHVTPEFGLALQRRAAGLHADRLPPRRSRTARGGRGREGRPSTRETFGREA